MSAPPIGQENRVTEPPRGSCARRRCDHRGRGALRTLPRGGPARRGPAGQRPHRAPRPPRTLSGADRTWCFFDLVPHAFESAITHRWRRWRVRNGDQEALRSAPGISYCRIPGERFYDRALERLAAAGRRVEIMRGVTVENLESRGAHVEVHTGAGCCARAWRWTAAAVADPRTR